MLLLRAPHPVAARDRTLTDEEIRALWGLDGAMGTLAKLAFLTAQRKGSLERARWDGIDVSSATWTIPAADMKSGKAHRAPLSDPALRLLEDWPKLGGPFIFGVGSGGARPFNGASNGADSLRGALGSHDWRLHDLRRTAVTLAQRGGAPVDDIRALTQHKVPGVIGVYARHDYEAEKRRVVAAIASAVDVILLPGQSGSSG